MKYTLILLLVVIGLPGLAQTRKASNIFFRIIDDRVEIFYDLPLNSDTLDIKVYFRKKSDPQQRYRLQEVSGSIGVGVFSGKKQKVTWRYKKEPAWLFTGSGFYYEIVVGRFRQNG